MNYKEEFENEIIEAKKSRNAFSESEKKQKQDYANFIQEAIPKFLEEQKQQQEVKKTENKFKIFISRLFKVL